MASFSLDQGSGYDVSDVFQAAVRLLDLVVGNDLETFLLQHRRGHAVARAQLTVEFPAVDLAATARRASRFQDRQASSQGSWSLMADARFCCMLLNTRSGCLVNSIFMPRGVPTGTWEFCRTFCLRCFAVGSPPLTNEDACGSEPMASSFQGAPGPTEGMLLGERGSVGVPAAHTPRRGPPGRTGGPATTPPAPGGPARRARGWTRRGSGVSARGGAGGGGTRPSSQGQGRARRRSNGPAPGRAPPRGAGPIWAIHGHTHPAGASIVIARVATPLASSSSSSPGRRASPSADVAPQVRIALRASRRYRAPTQAASKSPRCVIDRRSG